MKKCIIFCGGEKCGKDLFADKNLDEYTKICADSGYNFACEVGVKTDIIVGDFDSLGYVPSDLLGVEIIKYNSEKDDTDTLLAVKIALEKGFDYIEIYGALGGRFDHTFANIQTLKYIKDKNCEGVIVSENEEIRMIKNEKITIKKREKYALSVFSYSLISDGVCINGVKYPMLNGTLKSSFPLGISNEIINDFATISVESGTLIVVQAKIL